MLFLVLCGVFAGAEGRAEIQKLEQEKLDFLRRFRFFEIGIPINDRLGVYFANLPFDVASRKLAAIGERLALPKADCKVQEVKSASPGNIPAVRL